LNQDAFSLIGDALLAITESNVYRGNDDIAHADDALGFAVSLLVEARNLLRVPAQPTALDDRCNCGHNFASHDDDRPGCADLGLCAECQP